MSRVESQKSRERYARMKREEPEKYQNFLQKKRKRNARYNQTPRAKELRRAARRRYDLKTGRYKAPPG